MLLISFQPSFLVCRNTKLFFPLESYPFLNILMINDVPTLIIFLLTSIGISVFIYASIPVSVAISLSILISVYIYIITHTYQLRCANGAELHESPLSAHIQKIFILNLKENCLSEY